MSQPHWSTTGDGKIVAGATAFVNRKIIAPAEEGGYKNWFEAHCHHFIGYDSLSSTEHKLEYTELYETFQEKMESALEEYCTKENIDATEILQRVGDADAMSIKAGKVVQSLLNTFSYKKFCTLMRNKAKQIYPGEVTTTTTTATLKAAAKETNIPSKSKESKSSMSSDDKGSKASDYADEKQVHVRAAWADNK